MKRLLSILLLCPFLSSAQYTPGDTIKIKQAKKESYDYIFFGEGIKKKNKANNSIDNQTAVVIRSKKITTTSIPSDKITVAIAGDTFTIWMPFAQSNEEVEANEYIEDKGAYTASNGITYKIGDMIDIGRGSGLQGSFVFIHVGGWGEMLAAANGKKFAPLNAGHSGTKMKLKKIMYERNRRKQYEKVYFNVGGGNITDYRIDVENAISACEITPCNIPQKSGGAMSVADELKKLNDLREEGIITNEEFNEQKEKLLSR